MYSAGALASSSLPDFLTGLYHVCGAREWELAVGQKERLMGIGLGIILILAGLILVTGVVNYDINFIEDVTLGWILLIVGALALVLSLVINQQRSRTSTHVEEHHIDR